jgi:two-component system nitrogen regulation response regulator GlnG
LRPRAVAAAVPEARVPCFTVAWHPDPSRIGEVGVVGDNLSRLEPELVPAGGGSPRPLAAPHLSRTPIRIAAAPGGGLRLDAPAIAELVVDGAPVTGAIELAAAAIARGVVLELAARVVLVLHVRTAPAGAPARDPGELVGGSDAIAALRDAIAAVAPLDVPVLIGGETGAGKELIARALHRGSRRAGGPFVAVNLAALSPGTAPAQLFGHARGAFTGADRAHLGLFEQAAGGTLFLDEVGDAPEPVQAMLLRALEAREVLPIGGDTPRAVDVRVVAASDADLAGDPDFRPQLFHRLAGYRLAAPPLRDRRDDVGALLATFVARELAAAAGSVAAARLTSADPNAPPWLPAAAVRAYLAHAWPGNVRELANVARHLAVVGRAGPVSLADALAPIGGSAPREAAPAAASREIGDDLLVATLSAHRWQIAATAAALDVPRSTLYALMERCPKLRTARSLAADEIAACHTSHAGDLDAMAEALRVSRRGLQLRMRELGLAS